MLLSKATYSAFRLYIFFFISMCVFWELNPQPFALLMQWATGTHLTTIFVKMYQSEMITLLFRSQRENFTVHVLNKCHHSLFICDWKTFAVALFYNCPCSSKLAQVQLKLHDKVCLLLNISYKREPKQEPSDHEDMLFPWLPLCNSFFFNYI